MFYVVVGVVVNLNETKNITTAAETKKLHFSCIHLSVKIEKNNKKKIFYIKEITTDCFGFVFYFYFFYFL